MIVDIDGDEVSKEDVERWANSYLTADHIGYTVEKEEDMKMADTDKLKTEYVETYNRYMTLPDDSKELKTIAKKLQDLEQTLTRRFLFESGYTTEKKGEYCIFVKE